MCKPILSRMNWAGEHGMFRVPDLIFCALISEIKLFNLLVKRFMLSQVFLLADCILHFSCSSVSIFSVKTSVSLTCSSI